MDFTNNSVLKEHYTFLVADADAQVRTGEHGLYNRDTRLLSLYAWSWTSAGEVLTPLVVASPRPDTLHAHYAVIEGPSQRVAVRRTVTLTAATLTDEQRLENTSRDPCVVEVRLDLGADFVDLFEARGWSRLERAAPRVERLPGGVRVSHVALDGAEVAVTVTVRVAAAEPGTAEQVGDLLTPAWKLSLPPGSAASIAATVTIENPFDRHPVGAFGYDEWRAGFDERFAGLPAAIGSHPGLDRAVDDLRGLLLFTPEGPLAAAGIPWFVAAFGRDALLTAHLLLPLEPDLSAGTLRYLARYQGTKSDPKRAEQPGKIMHELRFGELTRTGRTPHSPYYGTVDATPLFVMLLDAHRRATGSLALVEELRPAWEGALRWLVEYGDIDGDDFIEFSPAVDGQGLKVQSWKDSHDSMSHADGSLAHGSLAVSEVQGYAYATYLATADWYQLLGDATQSVRWRERAERLRGRFHESFWLDDLGTYALALDGDKRPLRVSSSDSGQLLWTGIVPTSHAARLVDTLMSPRLWSGWGLRTLAEGEVRYNPVSYHNGSVWPHDTALFLGGLVRYGFMAEARQVRDALLALAAAQPDLRLPELVAGYARDGRPPVPYPVACRPQAWDAAALIHCACLEIERVDGDEA